MVLPAASTELHQDGVLYGLMLYTPSPCRYPNHLAGIGGAVTRTRTLVAFPTLKHVINVNVNGQTTVVPK